MKQHDFSGTRIFWFSVKQSKVVLKIEKEKERKIFLGMVAFQQSDLSRVLIRLVYFGFMGVSYNV